MNHRDVALGLFAALFAACATPPAAPEAASPPVFKDEPPPPRTLESDMAFHGGGDEPAESSAPPADSAPPAPPASGSAVPQNESESPAEAATGESAAGSPRDVLTTPDAAFMIDYAGSAPKRAAEDKCQQQHADDAAARAACMTQARDDFQADVLSFQKTGAGFSLVTYHRKGSSLVEVHKVPVAFSGETDKTVTVTFKGGEQGSRAIFKRARQFVVSVPNSYSIVLTDPDWGELHYDAKIGLVGPNR